MTEKEVRPAVTGPGAESEQCHALNRDYIPLKARSATLTKAGRILRALYAGDRLTRLDAWSRYGDSCLPTTVAHLQAKHGLTIARHTERVEGRFSAAHVARYWIAPTELEKACQAFAAELCAAGVYRTTAEALEALEGGE